MMKALNEVIATAKVFNVSTNDIDPYNKYLKDCALKYYTIPAELPFEDMEKIYSGDFSKAVHLGTLYGTLIFNKEAFDAGVDLYDLLDEHDEDIYYTFDTLARSYEPEDDDDDYEDGPFYFWDDEDYTFPETVFHISNIEITEGFNTVDAIKSMLSNLKDHIFMLYNVNPNAITFYAHPSEHEENLSDALNNMIASEMAGIKISAALDNSEEDKKKAENMQLADKQVQYVMGIRPVGECPYEEEYKDKEIWGAFAESDFIEFRDSRVLYTIDS